MLKPRFKHLIVGHCYWGKDPKREPKRVLFQEVLVVSGKHFRPVRSGPGPIRKKANFSAPKLDHQKKASVLYRTDMWKRKVVA